VRDESILLKEARQSKEANAYQLARRIDPKFDSAMNALYIIANYFYWD
jgi:hypothetical protein